jgi:hypothetical protein
MYREHLINRFREGSIVINHGRMLSFENFCDLPMIMEMVEEGLVVKKKKNFWRRIFSSTETYTYIGDSARGRVYSEIDPYGEEIWN